jgi:hypothetical protein
MEVLPVLIFCSLVGGALLSRYNKAGTGLLLGFCLGPIGLIIVVVMRNGESQKEAAQQQLKQMANVAAAANDSNTDDWGNKLTRECPCCAEDILKKAKVCKHCGRDVEPMAE